MNSSLALLHHVLVQKLSMFPCTCPQVLTRIVFALFGGLLFALHCSCAFAHHRTCATDTHQHHSTEEHCALSWFHPSVLVLYFDDVFPSSSSHLWVVPISLHELTLRCQQRCHHESYLGTLLFKKKSYLYFYIKYLLFEKIC